MKPFAFVCHCGWTYIRINKKLWFGPFFNAPITDRKMDSPVHSGSLMTHEEFKDGYADCYADYKRRKDND